jgi:hypothetical protein
LLSPHREAKTAIFGTDFRHDLAKREWQRQSMCTADGKVNRWPAKYPSLLVFQIQNERQAADRFGNSSDMIHKLYRALIKPQCGEFFWQLTGPGI